MKLFVTARRRSYLMQSVFREGRRVLSWKEIVLHSPYAHGTRQVLSDEKSQ